MKISMVPISIIVAALVCSLTSYAQPELTPIVIDHTPAALATDLPEALAELAPPQGALDRLTVVCPAAEGAPAVQVAWLSGDRYLWRVDLPEALPEGQYVSLYIDADADPTTGREDADGAELMAQFGLGFNRLTEYMADGSLADNRGLRTAVDGLTLWTTIDYPLAIDDGRTRASFSLSSPAGSVADTALTIPAEGPRLVRFENGSEVGGDLRLETVTLPGDDSRSATRITVTNAGETERWIDLSIPHTLALDGPVNWFDGFNFTPHQLGESALEFHGISAVTPLTAAWDGESGYALAFDPMDWYTEAHSSIRPSADGQQMRIGSRLALIPGESHTFTVNVLPYDGRLGWRGAFDAFWALYPEVYQRARDIDPRFHQASAGGLYRSWTDPEVEEFFLDLARRMRGKWEWGYAPAPRPGEWAVTNLSIGTWERRGGTKVATAESLEETRQHIRSWVHDTAERADIAVAYYMHLKNVEKGLMEQYWSDSYFQNEPIEYVGYYAGVPCWFAYPMANSYGEYMEEAIPLIAERFAPAGMAFDSVFGFIPHWGPSADRSPGTTFENGRAFVGEGIGFAHQMDQVRMQETGGYRTAMVTNLKLPTLSADAVRTDTALLEFHPMNNPGYRERILRLRMLSGQIMFNWWHSYEQGLYRWIPWGELTDEQTIDAYRRLADDTIIHSLYYGAVPNARFAVGVPKIMRLLPMLIEITDRGWQPVIAAEPQDSALLVSRYGEGVSLALGVANQGYEPIEDRVAIDREQAAGGADVALLDWTGAETVTVAGDTLTLEVSVPSRNVRAYRTVMLLPAGAAERMTATGSLNDYESSRVTVQVEAPAAVQAPVTIWLPEGAVNATIEPAGCVTDVQHTEDGLLNARLALTEGTNTITVNWQPSVALQGDREALLNYPFVLDGAANANIIAAGGTEGLGFRVQEFFREYYRWAVDEPQTVKLPIVTAEQAPQGRRVIVGMLEDLPASLQINLGDAEAAFGVQGEVVYATARTPEMLERALEGLLFTLDERYEWFGPFFPQQHFFRGDPSESPEALQRAGMAGKYLTGEDTGSLRDVMELPDLIEWR